MLRQEEAVANLREADHFKRIRAIRYAIDKGVNYINLGFPAYFKDPQKACEYVNIALADGYHSKVKHAINISMRDSTSQYDLDNALNSQLKLFKIEHAEFCVISDVDRTFRNTLKSIDIASWAIKTIASGRIDQIALGFHDDAHYLKGIVDEYPQWAFIQIEFSFLDYMHHPGVGCFSFAEESNIAIIATDITKAGRLLKNIPENVQKIYSGSKLNISPEERCVRWPLSFEEISSAQMSAHSELSTVEQVDRYFSYADRFEPAGTDIGEKLDAAKIREAYYASRECLCTICRLCMPCPAGIDAPRIIELINDEKMFTNVEIPKFQYNRDNLQSAGCSQCGNCVRLCKKHFPIDLIVNEANERYTS